MKEICLKYSLKEWRKKAVRNAGPSPVSIHKRKKNAQTPKFILGFHFLKDIFTFFFLMINLTFIAAGVEAKITPYLMSNFHEEV
ncbi:MAG: hypothetical protein C6W54_01715 [Bacillaceae bacterium]|nr:MAG: hypothetical protein C6W54_01715 [Bacillaceae bacterium]